MQHYINQLIEDLKEAKQKAPEDIVFSNNYEEFEAQMLAIENAPEISYEKLIGLTYEQFPPSDRLEVNQMIELTNAIEDTFEAFSIAVSLPDTVPLNTKYELIRELFKEEKQSMPGFSSVHDFCSGYCPDCKIADYCDSRITDY